MNIEANKTEFHGKWILSGKNVIADEIVEQIRYLTSTVLDKIADGDWEVLYRDPFDGRYWELTYLQSEMHGGGPPSLINVSTEIAKSKYKLNSPL